MSEFFDIEVKDLLHNEIGQDILWTEEEITADEAVISHGQGTPFHVKRVQAGRERLIQLQARLEEEQ